MAYTLDKDMVRVDQAILWVAEYGCPEEFAVDRRGTVKRVREAIQYAFSKGQLPGSEGIRPTSKGRLPERKRLNATEFFTWAAIKWRLLSTQEGIPHTPFTGASVFPMFVETGAYVGTPKARADLEIKLTDTHAELFNSQQGNAALQQEKEALRVENASQKKRIEELEKKKSKTSKSRSDAGKKGGRGKKKQPG